MKISGLSGRLGFATLLAAAMCFAVVGTGGCYKAKTKLAAGDASASMTAPNTLATAFPIANDGKATAEDVQATSITISGATLTKPVTLPEALGNIESDDSTTLAATFTSAAFEAGGTYTIHVDGTFREYGHKFDFSLAEDVQIEPAAPGSAAASSSSSAAQTVSGAHFPERPIAIPEEVNENEFVWTVPDGPERPAAEPSIQSMPQPAPVGDPPQVDFEMNTKLGFNSGEEPNEPSGAVSTGGIIFETANSYGSYSLDGTHFTRLNPTKIFPNDADGGFCCDQIVQYVPSIDRFIWVMQFNKGPNKLNRYRIAAASPATVKSSGGGDWTYWDITSTQIGGGTGWVDYPDASVGDHYFYLSADVVTHHGGRYVVRIPLSEIKSGSTIHFNYTDYTKGRMAYGGHLAQNAMDELYWAGQNNSSTLRVFSWPESTDNYNWTDVPIGIWPNKASFPHGMSSTTPDTTPKRTDWLKKLSGFPGNAVLGATRLVKGTDRKKQNELILGWTGCRGLGFPQPQVQWVALDLDNNFKLLSQQQIWNASVAYAYPSFGVNSDKEIGMSLEYGGGGNYENHVAGFWSDFVLYVTTASNEGTDRYGDYVTIRPYWPDQKRFAAFGYGENKSGFDTRYIVFSRPRE